MPIITYIDGIPLFTTKSEAILYGSSSTPRRPGYHTHVHEGILGYMAGYYHPVIKKRTDLPKPPDRRVITREEYLSDVLEASNSINEEIQQLEEEATNLQFEAEKIKEEQERQRKERERKEKLNSLLQSISFLQGEKGKIKEIELLIQKANIKEFEELLEKNELPLNISSSTQNTISVVEEVISSSQPVEQETIQEQVEQEELVDPRGAEVEEFERRLRETEERRKKEATKVSDEDLRRLEQEARRRLEEEARRREAGGY